MQDSTDRRKDVEHMEENQIVRPGEDCRNEDNLLVCGRCGKPKEKKLPAMDLFGGRERIVRVMCDCEIREQQEREEQERLRKAAERAKRLRDGCFHGSPFFRDCTFAMDDGRTPKQSDLCKRYAETFDPTDSGGLLLWGGVGTGKTFMASCIANAVIDLGYTAYQTDIAGIANIMESSFEHRRANLDRILNHDLLLIEDLGAERCTEYMLGNVYTVIDGRYRSGKPMVITTNISLKDIYQPSSSSPWCRIFDRITERCYPIEFTGASRRRSRAAVMRRSMEERLGIRLKD